MSLFPGAIASFLGFTSGHTLAADSHAAQHNSEQAEIIAAQTKIGTGASTPASGLLLRGNGAGTSAWAQANLTSDVTGVLPQANGGTGTTLSTGTGKAVYDTSPTIVTPTIASFTNSTHTHLNTAGGGTLSAAAVPALDLSVQTLFNPYKFRVYRHAALTLTAITLTSLPFDTKTYDTSSNVDIVTNQGRFTVPVAGFYHFDGRCSIGAAANGRLIGFIRKNGVALNDASLSRGNDNSGGTNPIGVSASDTIKCVAGDYVEFAYYSTNATALEPTDDVAYFSGYLVSNT